MGDLSDGQAGISVLEGPALVDAFVERFAVAATADGPLRGTRFAAKDLFDVAGRHTGCGNPTWRDTHAPAIRHAAVVRMLLQAGAALAGKTRTDEMAYSIEGRNFHEGAPLNPAAPDRLTGGSSSGSAAAAAGGDVDFAMGTDTAGSVRVPAAWCGVTGLRPTHARVPVEGLTPLAPSFDSVGWFARSAAVMSAVGAVLLGEGAIPVPAGGLVLVRDAEIDACADAGVRAVLEPWFAACARRGLPAGSVTLGVDRAAAAECLRVLQAHEAWRAHGAWIAAARPQFGPGVAERFAAARAISEDQVGAAARDRAAIIARVDAVLPPGRVLCLPTVPGPAPRRDASTEQLRLQRTRVLALTALASLTGRPQLTVPVRLPDGSPVGFSMLGWRYGDEALLDMARWLSPA